MPMASVVDRFLQDADCKRLTVVKDRKPYGLLTRSHAMEIAASSSQTVLNLLRVEEVCIQNLPRINGDVSVEQLVREHKETNFAALQNGAMVTSGRKYAGVLSLTGLLGALSVDPQTESDDLPSSPDAIFQSTQFVLASLAHEVRTPLTGMMGLADLLVNRLEDPDKRDIAKTIARSGETLDRILRDTLDFVSLESGKLSIQSESADLGELTNDLLQLWSVQAERRGLSLHAALSAGSPDRVNIDLGRVRQILNNLVSNALKFTKSGSVRVNLEVLELAEGMQFLATVADTGRGIPDADKRRLFEAFEKGHVPEDGPGWGLGLAISHALSRHLGGELTLSDNPDGGSLFQLSVPVTASEIVSIKPAKKPKSGRFMLGEVLVIEDHDACAMVVVAALEMAGWKVRVASTLCEAEDLLAYSRYQAVLTDLHLVDGSALSIIESIRSGDSINADIPILAMTADISEGTRQACLAVGADRALRKPIHGPALVATLADALMSRASDEGIGESSSPQLRGRIAS